MKSLYIHVPIYDHILGEKNVGMSLSEIDASLLSGTYDSIYIGSGNPLSSDMENVYKVVGSHASLSTQISIEINEPLSTSKIKEAIGQGVNRFVFGQVSLSYLSDTILFLRSYPSLSIALDIEMGDSDFFDKISLDLDHVSVYPLDDQTLNHYAKQLQIIDEKMYLKGLVRYELHSYARQGHQSLLLVSLHQFDDYDSWGGVYRRDGIRYEIDGQIEILSQKDLIFEYQYHGLHLSSRINVLGFKEIFDLELDTSFYEMYDDWFERDKNSIRLSFQGRVQFESVILKLYEKSELD